MVLHATSFSSLPVPLKRWNRLAKQGIYERWASQTARLYVSLNAAQNGRSRRKAKTYLDQGGEIWLTQNHTKIISLATAKKGVVVGI